MRARVTACTARRVRRDHLGDPCAWTFPLASSRRSAHGTRAGLSVPQVAACTPFQPLLALDALHVVRRLRRPGGLHGRARARGAGHHVRGHEVDHHDARRLGGPGGGGPPDLPEGAGVGSDVTRIPTPCRCRPRARPARGPPEACARGCSRCSRGRPACRSRRCLAAAAVSLAGHTHLLALRRHDRVVHGRRRESPPLPIFVTSATCGVTTVARYDIWWYSDTQLASKNGTHKTKRISGPPIQRGECPWCRPRSSSRHIQSLPHVLPGACRFDGSRGPASLTIEGCTRSSAGSRSLRIARLAAALDCDADDLLSGSRRRAR